MPKRRTLLSHYRFALFLLSEFRWPLIVFWGLVFGGGLLIWLTYKAAPVQYSVACYSVFMMILVQNVIPFPEAEWYLQPLWFLFPILGLGAVADSLVRLGYLVFTTKRKLQEWQLMNASMYRNHFVVVGAGKVGYRIIKELLALQADFTVIERQTDTPLVTELIDLGVTIIRGEARLRRTLEQAGVAHARAVILATDDDLTNLDAALTAREIRPDVRVVLRLFDETLATKVAAAFKMPAISTSGTSAPAFIAAATGRSVYQSFCLDGGATLHVADVAVEPGSTLAGKNVGDIQIRYGVNVVLHKRDGNVNVNPDHALLLEPNDKMLVIAPIEKIAALERN